MSDLLVDALIVDVGNAEAAKVETIMSEEAFVEYQINITFKVNGKRHTVKLTAYTTTCSIQIQPKGEPPSIQDHLGGRCTPRFFIENYLITWC